MKNWLKLMLFALPLVLILVIVNYQLDPAGIIRGSDSNYSIALKILSGEKAYIGKKNLDERGVKAALIKNLPEYVDTVALGPSLVMCVRSSIVGTDDFYNLGVSAATYYDILAQLGMLKFYNKKFKRVIICVDTFFFDERIYKSESRSLPYVQFANYMLNTLNGKKVKTPKIEVKNVYWTKFSQLFSLTYFQAAVKDLIISYDEKKDDGFGHYCSDASWVYPTSYQNKGVEFVKSDSLTYNYDSSYAHENEHLSSEAVETFEKLMKTFAEERISILLFLCPVSPTLYDRIDFEKHPLPDELEIFAHSMAEKYGAKLTGSYNPYNYNMTDDDFYDARHVRAERLGAYFDFGP